jgi:hypothetical protein
MSIEWKSRVDFAEAAETLGVRTDQIAALRVDSDGPVAVWSQPIVGTDGSTIETVKAFVSLLARDEDGVLVERARKPMPVAEFGELLERLVRACGLPPEKP